MPDPVGVTVPEVAPVRVSRNRAWRIVVGRFLVRWVEAFGGALIGVGFFMPSNAADVQKLLALVIPPSVVAFYQAGRSAWPALRKWLESGGAEPPE